MSPVPVPVLSRFSLLLPVSDPVSSRVPSSFTVPVFALVPVSVVLPELEPVLDVVPLVSVFPSLLPATSCVLDSVVFSALVKYCSASKSVKSFCGVSLRIVLLVVEPVVLSVVFPVVETVVETVVESVVEPVVSLELDVASLRSSVRVLLFFPVLELSLEVEPVVVSENVSLFSWCS